MYEQGLKRVHQCVKSQIRWNRYIPKIKNRLSIQDSGWSCNDSINKLPNNIVLNWMIVSILLIFWIWNLATKSYYKVRLWGRKGRTLISMIDTQLGRLQSLLYVFTLSGEDTIRKQLWAKWGRWLKDVGHFASTSQPHSEQKSKCQSIKTHNDLRPLNVA